MSHITDAGYIAYGFIVAITIVVFFHELGHFLVGRWCGVKVDAFSIGFGPEIAAWVDLKGTRWRVGALPLGGYVKFHGDLNAAGVADGGAIAHMSPAERAVSFPAQPIWKRAAIVAAGPTANFILAIAIMTAFFYAAGIPSSDARIGTVTPGLPAAAAGFRTGDVVTAIDSRPIGTFEAMRDVVARSPGRPLQFSVLRDGRDVALTAVPATVQPSGDKRDGSAGPTGQLGVGLSMQPVSLPEAVAEAAEWCWVPVAATGQYVGKVLSLQAKPDQFSGPIGIAVVAGQAAQMGVMTLLRLVALLSVSIGLTNLLPIPLLDGGHLLYYGCEFVRGRPLTARVQEIGFRVGLACVLLLIVLTLKNDLFGKLLG